MIGIDPTTIFVFTTVASAVVLASSSDSALLGLTVSPEKSFYLKGEPISLTITLENLSINDLVVNRRLSYPGPDLMIEVTDQLGNRLRWLPAAPPPSLGKSDFVVLNPMAKVTVQISDLESDLFDKFTQENQYSLKVRYTNTDDGSRFNYRAWTGSIVSNTIDFRIGG